jgi:hypothetical protein
VSNSERAAAHLATRSKVVGQSCPACHQKLRKPRSYQAHKRYFAMIKAVHFHWPENHPRMFANEEALRKWAQMKAGHYTSKSIDLYGIPALKARLIVEAALEAASPYSEARVLGKSLVIFSPKSVNYDTLGHAEFTALSADVEEIIRQETGLDPERVLSETEQAA